MKRPQETRAKEEIETLSHLPIWDYLKLLLPLPLLISVQLNTGAKILKCPNSIERKQDSLCAVCLAGPELRARAAAHCSLQSLALRWKQCAARAALCRRTLHWLAHSIWGPFGPLFLTLGALLVPLRLGGPPSEQLPDEVRRQEQRAEARGPFPSRLGLGLGIDVGGQSAGRCSSARRGQVSEFNYF